MLIDISYMIIHSSNTGFVLELCTYMVCTGWFCTYSSTNHTEIRTELKFSAVRIIKKEEKLL